MQPFAGDLIVTPKEIDTLVDDISLVISASLELLSTRKLPKKKRAALWH